MGKRKTGLGVLTCALCMLLSGCFFRGVDQLYAVPQPSREYEALQACLGEVVSQGGEYAAPLSGDMIQSVQLQDVDGDGRQEAIAFFRMASEEKPLKIYIFHQVGDTYETMAVIEGAGTAFNSVDYVQMDNEPSREIVVSWQMSTQVHALTVYSVGRSQVDEILRTDYDGYRLCDLDQDNQQELVVFRTPTEGPARAELYNFDGVVSLVDTAPLSAGALVSADGTAKSDYLTGVQFGYLKERIPAVFATSSYGERSAVTDIFICRDGKLENITLDPSSGDSQSTLRVYTQVSPIDINGDGIMEVPRPAPLAEYRINSGSVNFWQVHWTQFDAGGNSERIFTTYYNDRDGWYFILPEEWGKNGFTLSRVDLPGGSERAVTFSSWSGELDTEPQPFLTIYKLTGSNRMTRARLGKRFIITPASIANDGNIIYAAEFRDGWDCGLTEDEVRERFAVIKTDWYSG